MKKMIRRRIAAALMSLLLMVGLLPAATVTVLAAPPQSVDYYVTVTAPDGLGVNMRQAAGAEYALVKDTPIPMGALLHITMEQVAENGNAWGYTSYEENGRLYAGWVSLTQVTRVEEPEQESEAPVEQEPAVDDVPPADAEMPGVGDAEQPAPEEEPVEQESAQTGDSVEGTEDESPEGAQEAQDAAAVPEAASQNWIDIALIAAGVLCAALVIGVVVYLATKKKHE